ncbi:unnamed protein product, partial [Onchocerca flexuosa]|uniref:IBB domain-containing protein n=1 Tax=Onchocerca flexuosa TaxID=387005 RepID=A0A183I7V7_9BILA
EKPVSIPQRRDGRKPRPPPDFVRNVVGSSAAAGSAEFHIFRNNRKREMDRQRYKQKMKNLRKKNEAKNLDETDEDDSESSSVSERSKQNTNEENREIVQTVGNSGTQDAKSEMVYTEMEKISDPNLSVEDILENRVKCEKEGT